MSWRVAEGGGFRTKCCSLHHISGELGNPGKEQYLKDSDTVLHPWLKGKWLSSSDPIPLCIFLGLENWEEETRIGIQACHSIAVCYMGK